MADFNQFGSVKPGLTGDPQHCAQCEAMLTDALDGTLSPADQTTFDLHIMGCPSCTDMLADARRGAAWMEMLHTPRPEPPASLLERILIQTSGIQTSGQAEANGRSDVFQPIVVGGADRVNPAVVRSPNTLLGHPVLVSRPGAPRAAYSSSNVLPFRSRLTHGLRSLGQTMLQPRLAMTAAMAFFSIALTLNLTGVRLSQLRASDLRPSSIVRSCYEAKAKVVRYSDNLRVVYELESRVRDLQQSSDDAGRPGVASTPPATQNEPAAQPGKKPADPQQQPDGHHIDQKQNRPRPSPGSSRRETPGGAIRQVDSFQRLYTLPGATEALVWIPLVKPEGELV